MIPPLVARSVALAGVGTLAGLAVAIPRLLRLGATREEAREPLRGDDEIPHAQVQGTRAITIHVPPERVWPWLAQIGYHGYDRAGWYAYDLADNDGVPSLWQIVPEFQHPLVGQMIGEEGFTVRAIEPNQLLLLSYHYPKTSWVVKQGLWPRFGHCSWAFILRRTPDGGTRLITRMRYRVSHLDRSVPFWPLFLAADAMVQPKMLSGIKRRAESAAGNSAPAPPIAASTTTAS